MSARDGSDSAIGSFAIARSTAQLRGERHASAHLDAGLKVLICSITGFHSACSVRI